MPLSCKIMAFCLGVSTILSRRRLSHPTRVWRRFFVPSTLRRNFSLVTRYSLKFTRCSLLVVKSLVTRCKIRSLLVAEVARCKKSLVTRYEKSPGTNVYLKPLKLGEFYLFVLYFQLTKNRERFRTQ